MQQIDLEPHQFAPIDPSTGQVRRRISKRMYKWYTCYCLGVLVLLYFGKAPETSFSMFWLTAAFAFGAGVTAAHWLRDLY